MGGSPRGPSRRPGAWTGRRGWGGGDGAKAKIPAGALVVAATCALLLLLLWRAGSLEHIFINGVLELRGSSATPRSSGVLLSQPATAYGQLLREQGLLLPGSSSCSSSADAEGAVAARAECASSHPSITEHLLRGFHLPGLDVDDQLSDDAEADVDADAEDDDATTGRSADSGEDKNKKIKRRGGFVYHQKSSSGGVEGVRRDPEPRHGSCAVVGSSRVLLGSQHGGEIDSHDAVIRFDDAPTRGFENILGRRTTYRVASPAFVASVTAGAPTAVRTIAGAAHLVPGAKALVVGEDTSAEQQRDVQEKVPALLLYPVSLGVTDKVEEFYKEFARRVTALAAPTGGGGTGGGGVGGGGKPSTVKAAEEVPMSLVGVFFAMHSCDEIHVYGVPPPGAERHVADDNYYTAHGTGGGGAVSKGGGGKKAGGGGGGSEAGIGDDVTRLILRVLALEGYIHNHP